MPAPKRWLLGLGLLAVGFVAGAGAVFAWERWHGPPPPAAAEEAPPRCWEAVVYLPLTDGQGKPFPDTTVEEAVGSLVSTFGGATLGDRRDGYWLDEHGRLRRETVRPVTISFPRERLAGFRQAVRDVGRRLGQECMYVRLEEPRVELIRSGAETTAP
jgi:hypothetical protein